VGDEGGADLGRQRSWEGPGPAPRRWITRRMSSWERTAGDGNSSKYGEVPGFAIDSRLVVMNRPIPTIPRAVCSPGRRGEREKLS